MEAGSPKRFGAVVVLALLAGAVAPVEARPEESFAGRVVDAAGSPLAGARVRLRPAGVSWATPWHGERTATTSEDGRFRVLAPTFDSGYLVRAELGGYAPAEVGPVPGGSERLEIVLSPGTTISGRLVDLRGRSVRGARVRLIRFPESSGTGGHLSLSAWLPADVEAETAEDGRFTARHLAGGRYGMGAWHPDFAARVLPLELPAEGTVDLGEIALEDGATLSGVVVDRDGRPMDGVRVLAGPSSTSPRDPPASYERGHSDEAGRFRIPGLPFGVELRLTASGPDHLPVTIDEVSLPLAEPLRVVVSRGASVFGRVLGPAGEGVADAQVSASVQRGEDALVQGSESRGARSAADGSFRITALPAGRLRVEVQAPRYVDGELAGLTLQGEDELGPLEIRLEGGAELSGVVLAPDGTPAPGVAVGVGPRRDTVTFGKASRDWTSWGRSDARGGFTVGGLALGPTTVRALHDRFGDAMVELEIRPGPNTVRLVLTLDGRVHGRVIDGDGAPVAAAEVTLWSDAEVIRESRHTNADGSFLFRWIEPGSYRLRTASPGLRMDGPPGSVTVADSPPPAVELRLVAGEELTGQVFGLDPEDLEGVSIGGQLQAEEERWLDPATAGSDGRYRLPGLGPGRWTVWAVRRDTGQHVSGEVDVTAGGGPYRLDLDFGAGLTLTGSLRVQGEPLTHASIAVRGKEGSQTATVMPAGDGDFRIDGLRPGEYELLIMASTLLIHHHPLVLDADDEVHLDLPAATLEGRLLDADGEAVTGGMVMLTSAVPGPALDRRRVTVPTDSAGRFDLQRVTPGEYEVIAGVEGRPMARRVVYLAAGDHRELELRLESGAELVLVARTPDGGPPAQLTLLAFQGGDLPIYHGKAAPSADGTTTFSDLPLGDLVLAVFGDGTAIVDATVQVPGPRLALTLPPPTVLEIEAPEWVDSGLLPLVVTGPDGGVPAAASYIGGPKLYQRRARISQLPPGTWTVRLALPDGVTLEGTATTAPGQPTRLLLAAGPADGAPTRSDRAP